MCLAPSKCPNGTLCLTSIHYSKLLNFRHTLLALMTHRVALNSTVSTKGVAYLDQVIVFTCITRDSLILEWYSNEYIGTGGHRLQLVSVNCIGANETSDIPGTSATCLNVTKENNETVIVSQLLVRAYLQIPASTVTCNNNGHGSNKSVTFQTEGKIDVFFMCVVA